MRAILVNPWTKEITELEIEPGIHAIYRQLSNPLGPKVDCFCVGVSWPNGDTLYVDDEGLLKSGMRLWDAGRRDRQLLAGNGLILGSSRNGNSVSAKTPLVDLQVQFKFTNLETM